MRFQKIITHLQLFKKSGKSSDNSLLQFLGHTNNTRVLIVNADDVGMHKSVNDAVFDLFDKGRISSMSVMACTSEVDHAIAEIKRRDIPVGVHLTLTNEWQKRFPWKGVLPEDLAPSLYNSEGLLWASVEEVAKHATKADILNEFSAQIEKLIVSGITLSHLDTHMILTEGNPLLMDCYLAVSKKYNLPVVLQLDGVMALYAIEKQKLQAQGFYPADSYIMHYNRKLALNNPSKKARAYFKTLKNLPPGVHHLVIHPALNCTNQEGGLLDTFLRFHDYQTFLHEKMGELLTKFTLINYIQIKKPHNLINAFLL